MSKETRQGKPSKSLKSKVRKTAADLEATKKVSGEVPVKVWDKPARPDASQTATDTGNFEVRKMESPDDIVRRRGYKRFDF